MMVKIFLIFSLITLATLASGRIINDRAADSSFLSGLFNRFKHSFGERIYGGPRRFQQYYPYRGYFEEEGYEDLGDIGLSSKNKPKENQENLKKKSFEKHDYQGIASENQEKNKQENSFVYKPKSEIDKNKAEEQITTLGQSENKQINEYKRNNRKEQEIKKFGQEQNQQEKSREVNYGFKNEENKRQEQGQSEYGENARIDGEKQRKNEFKNEFTKTIFNNGRKDNINNYNSSPTNKHIVNTEDLQNKINSLDEGYIHAIKILEDKLQNSDKKGTLEQIKNIKEAMERFKFLKQRMNRYINDPRSISENENILQYFERLYETEKDRISRIILDNRNVQTIPGNYENLEVQLKKEQLKNSTEYPPENTKKSYQLSPNYNNQLTK